MVLIALQGREAGACNHPPREAKRQPQGEEGVVDRASQLRREWSCMQTLLMIELTRFYWQWVAPLHAALDGCVRQALDTEMPASVFSYEYYTAQIPIGVMYNGSLTAYLPPCWTSSAGPRHLRTGPRPPAAVPWTSLQALATAILYQARYPAGCGRILHGASWLSTRARLARHCPSFTAR